MYICGLMATFRQIWSLIGIWLWVSEKVFAQLILNSTTLDIVKLLDLKKKKKKSIKK